MSDASDILRRNQRHASEIIFIITEDVDGGYNARAEWPNRGIFTQGESREELIRNIREAVEVSFNEEEPKPRLAHLHFVRDEVIAL